MAPGDYAGLQANRPRRLHSGTRSFSIAFFAGPEFLLLHLYTALLLPALFLAFARKNPLRIFALRGNRFVGAPSARNRRKERLDLPLPVQLGAPANPAQGDMRMVLVAPFATKRCRPGLRSRFLRAKGIASRISPRFAQRRNPFYTRKRVFRILDLCGEKIRRAAARPEREGV